MRSANKFDQIIMVSFSQRTEKGSKFHILCFIYLFITFVGNYTLKKIHICTLKSFKKLVFFLVKPLHNAVCIKWQIDIGLLILKSKGSNVQIRQFAFQLRNNTKFQKKITLSFHFFCTFFNTIICWTTGGWWLACLLMLNSNSAVLSYNFTSREHIVLSSKALCIITSCTYRHHVLHLIITDR